MNPDDSPDIEVTKPKETTDPQPEALINGFIDRINNFTVAALGYKDMREMGLDTPTSPAEDLDQLLNRFEELKANLEGAKRRLRQNKPLYLDIMDGVDFDHYDYTSDEDTLEVKPSS
jgi:hypothetical protein